MVHAEQPVREAGFLVVIVPYREADEPPTVEPSARGAASPSAGTRARSRSATGKADFGSSPSGCPSPARRPDRVTQRHLLARGHPPQGDPTRPIWPPPADVCGCPTSSRSRSLSSSNATPVPGVTDRETIRPHRPSVAPEPRSARHEPSSPRAQRHALHELPQRNRPVGGQREVYPQRIVAEAVAALVGDGWPSMRPVT